MAANREWTPRTGWWKAARRLLLRGALSMGLSLGAACLLAWVFFTQPPRIERVLWEVRVLLWAPVAVFPGFFGGLLVSRKLVERTGLVGAPLAMAAAAALIAAHLGAFGLGLAALGEEWFLRMAAFQAAACLVALAFAVRQVLLDS